MCGVLAVSESGLYAWRKRSASLRGREDAEVRTKDSASVSITSGRYGSPRIVRKVHDEWINCSRQRIVRLMRQENLSARHKRRRLMTTKRDMTHPVAPNLLQREFTASAPNQQWVTDTTYIPTRQGWLSLAVILDLYSRIVVRWSMPSNCEEKLLENALSQALARHRPQALHHSDKGRQYTSNVYQAYFRALWNTAFDIAKRKLLGSCCNGVIL
jgi:putative transposase